MGEKDSEFPDGFKTFFNALDIYLGIGYNVV